MNRQHTKKRAEAQLRQFLQAHKTSKDDPKKTHSPFDAGTLLTVQGPFCIRDRDKPKFYKLYSNCYNAGTRLNLTEGKPSSKWSFFLDCDGKPDKTPTVIKHIKPFKLALLKAIIPATLKFAYGSKIATHVQLEMQTKTKDPTRLHFFLTSPGPNLVLDAQTAKVLRHHLIWSCIKWSQSTLPHQFPESELIHFIDPIMQNCVGLRMYGSLKNTPTDTNYVHPNQSVTPEALHKYSIHPVGIATKHVTELSSRIKKWYKKSTQTQ